MSVPNQTSNAAANAVVISMKGPGESVAAACLVLANMPGMEVDTREKAETVLNAIEKAYEGICKKADPANGALEALLGFEFMNKHDPAYVSVKSKSSYRQEQYDEAVDLVTTTAGNHLERILGLAQMQTCSGSNEVQLGFRASMRVRPTPQTVYAFLRAKWLSGSTENKAELDKTIATDFNASSTDSIAASLASFRLACTQRNVVCNAPLAETDQVEKVMEKLDKISAIQKFVGDFNQRHKEGDRTVDKITAELAEYMRNDRDRITTALHEAAGANGHHRAYAAQRSTASASQNASQHSAKKGSGSASRDGSPAPRGTATGSSERDRDKTMAKVLISELVKTATDKGFCVYCLQDGHRVDQGAGCYALQKVLKASKENKDTKDGVGAGGRDGGRGRKGR